jgi:hypothetical protein
MASFTVGSSHHRVLDRQAHHDGAISRAVDADRLARPVLPSVLRPSADESNSRAPSGMSVHRQVSSNMDRLAARWCP